MRALRTVGALVLVGSLALAGCGDDGGEAADAAGAAPGTSADDGGTAGGDDASGDLCLLLNRVDYISSWQPETFEEEAAAVEGAIAGLDAEVQDAIELMIETNRASILDQDVQGLASAEYADALAQFVAFYAVTCQ